MELTRRVLLSIPLATALVSKPASKWAVFKVPGIEGTWFTQYNKEGYPKAKWSQYKVKLPQDPQICVDGNLGDAVDRGTATETVIGLRDMACSPRDGDIRDGWAIIRHPESLLAWSPLYGETGNPVHSVVMYEYKMPLCPILMKDGDLESACARGVARRTLLSGKQIIDNLELINSVRVKL